MRLEDYEAAAKVFKELVEILEGDLGPNQSGTLTFKRCHADCLLKQGWNEEAVTEM